MYQNISAIWILILHMCIYYYQDYQYISNLKTVLDIFYERTIFTYLLIHLFIPV